MDWLPSGYEDDDKADDNLDHQCLTGETQEDTKSNHSPRSFNDLVSKP